VSGRSGVAPPTLTERREEIGARHSGGGCRGGAASLPPTLTELRIIAGEFKGRRLVVPRGRTTRPTADQVRTALMDALMPWLPGVRFLDLFAGAGGVGLEALSRGAVHVTFVERDHQALRALHANIRTLALQNRTRVLAQDVAGAIDRLRREGQRYGVVFLDPPYGDALAVAAALAALTRGSLLEAAGLVIVQHPSKDPPAPLQEHRLAPAGVPGPGGPRERAALVVTRTRKFGETTLTFFRGEG
jgi:16S rRNA (guanine966-N2)-methyltransferase